jgi:hypothetical protein
MRTQFILSFILLLTSIFCMKSFSNTDGYFLDLQKFKKPYIFYQTPRALDIQDYIELINTKAEHAYETSNAILSVSQCLGIDTIFLTTMIRQESNFSHQAVSPTHAVGLTQMTSIAIREVKDQLGIRGPRYARKSITDFLKAQLKDCYGEESLKRLLKLMLSNSNTIKKRVKEDIFTSVLIGSIILKIALSRRNSNNLLDTYRGAFEAYNGDDIKKSYASKILNYASKLNKSLF